MTSAPDSRPGQADAAPGQDVGRPLAAAMTGSPARAWPASCGCAGARAGVTEIDGAGGAQREPGARPARMRAVMRAPGLRHGTVRVAVGGRGRVLVLLVAPWDLRQALARAIAP